MQKSQNLAFFVNFWQKTTGKSLSEALILASTNPQYDERLIIELPVEYMKIPSSEHIVYINCSQCQNKNRKTISVHNMFWPWNFHVLDKRISASEKDFPVLKRNKFFLSPCATFSREITEPLRKLKIRINDLCENVPY